MFWLRKIQWLNNSAVSYLLVGVLNTVIGLSVIYLAKWLLGLGDIISNVIGYAVGVTMSFTLNKKWSFRHEGQVMSSFIRFIAVILVAYFANLYVVIICIEFFMVNSYISQAIGIIPYTIIGYLGSKFFAFKHRQVS